MTVNFAAIDELIDKLAQTKPSNEKQIEVFKRQKPDVLDEMYREYQSNIRAAATMRAEIIKGISTGEPIENLFLKACEVISKMTGDKLFFEKAK